MRWGLFGVKLGIVAVNLIIAAIILLAVVPLATGGLDVDIPQTGESSWTLEGDVLQLNAPISVYNGGFYDLEDFSLGLHVEDENGDQVMDDRTDPVDLKAGRTTDVDLGLNLDIGDVPLERKRQLVFEGASFDISVTVQTYYIMSLMKLEMTISDEMQWSPLISDYGIDQSGIRYQYSGSQIEMIVPYHISTSDLVNGHVIGVSSELRNSTSVLGTGSEYVTLTQFTNGEFHFILTQDSTNWLATHSETLNVTLDLTFMGATASETFQYYWNTPGP
ncbi:MAG: hypothetical protein LUQ14_03985 [Methanomassiliicoccales archaeon]|nr:hypothetical protein [Methanomassiliicoccales archaeon]